MAKQEERCAFCGRPKDGRHIFVSGLTGKVVCFKCIKVLKGMIDTLDSTKKIISIEERPDDSQRTD